MLWDRGWWLRRLVYLSIRFIVSECYERLRFYVDLNMKMLVYKLSMKEVIIVFRWIFEIKVMYMNIFVVF